MIELLREIADSVGRALSSSERKYWKEPAGMGADGTLTNKIDLISENSVREVLKRHGNPLNILSEEAGFIDFGREQTLVLDPIDGTYNALNGIPFYSISLAVSGTGMKDTHWALVRNLASGDEYYAAKGKGAFLNGEAIHTRKLDPDNPVFSVFLGKSASKLSLELALKCGRIRSMGSAALEISQVASGAYDMYCYCSDNRNGGLRIVDIAAASLILREAGGKVLDRNLITLDMELDVTKRSTVIALANASVSEMIS